MTLYKKILFAGDPHGKFKQINDAAVKCQPEAIVLLGDCDLEYPLDKYLKIAAEISKIFWIPGNHDFSKQRWHDNLFNSSHAVESIHLKVITVAGIRIAGLGGVFLGNIWYPPELPKFTNLQEFLAAKPSNIRRQGGLLKHRSAIFSDEVEKLKALQADILVTHEAPSCHRHGFGAVDNVANAMGVKKIIHGHHHEDYRSSISKDIQVYGVGMREVIDLSGEVVSKPERVHE